MNDKYLTYTLLEMQAAVNQLALDCMLPIFIEDPTDEQTEKRNVFVAIYNDGIRCFAESLNSRLIEEAAKKE